MYRVRGVKQALFLAAGRDCRALVSGRPALRSVLTWEERLTAGVVVAGERDAPIGSDHNP
jgi:hypothetical protein